MAVLPETPTVSRDGTDSVQATGGVPGPELAQVEGAFCFFLSLSSFPPQTYLGLHAKRACIPICLEPSVSINTHAFILLETYGENINKY